MQRIDDRSLVAAEKPELTVLPTPELNAETPAHLLDDDITPTDRLFVRNTGFMPGFSDAELADGKRQFADYEIAGKEDFFFLRALSRIMDISRVPHLKNRLGILMPAVEKQAVA